MWLRWAEPGNSDLLLSGGLALGFCLQTPPPHPWNEPGRDSGLWPLPSAHVCVESRAEAWLWAKGICRCQFGKLYTCLTCRGEKGCPHLGQRNPWVGTVPSIKWNQPYSYIPRLVLSTGKGARGGGALAIGAAWCLLLGL